jgi:hypothetical protein
MKRICLALLCGLFFFNLSGDAQTPRPETAAETAARMARERKEVTDEAAALQSKIRGASAPKKIDPALFEKSVKPLYRKPTREELKAIAPSVEDSEKYAEFLRRSNTGLIKLAADTGCAANIDIVVAKSECLKYTMPGAGTAYSFRTESYRPQRLADIIYTNNNLQSASVLQQGILVSIGDVPLEKVDLQTVGLRFLTNFQPESNPDKANEFVEKLNKGIVSDNFQYGLSLPAAENATYVLRSMAYEGISPRNTAEGIQYNELEFDKRQDILVAFRIVRRDSDSITVLWKELWRKNPPKLERPNPQKKK